MERTVPKIHEATEEITMNKQTTNKKPTQLRGISPLTFGAGTSYTHVVDTS
jgi:hypothetical protein